MAMFKRARNRRRGQRQHVDFGAQRLELLLVAHAEAVFFVDDDQAEILEMHVLLQQAVRADDDIDGPSATLASDRVGFLFGAGSAR